MKASFLGQTPVPPWVFFLIASYVFIFLQKYRTVVATDRNIYVMENAFLRSYKFRGVAHKVPIASASIDSSSSSNALRLVSGSWAFSSGAEDATLPRSS